MRTTITLDDDVAAQLRRVTRERNISFKEAVNSAIRAGLGGEKRATPYRLRTFRMGLRPGIDLDRARHLADALEEEDTVRKLELRK